MRSERLCYGVGVRDVRYFCWLLCASGLLLACGDDAAPGALGAACLTTADCESALVCFQTMARGNECMAPCTADDRLCDDGSVCLAGPSEVHVCYLGGEVELGDTCTDGGDCVMGAVCVTENDEAFCRAACDTRAPDCRSSQECVELTAPSGYCAES